MTEQEKQIIKEWEARYEAARGAEEDELFNREHTLTIIIKEEFHDVVREALDDWQFEDEEDGFVEEGELCVSAGTPPVFIWDVSDEAFAEWLAEDNNLKPEWIDHWRMDG